MASKKQLEKRIKQLEEQVRKLENMHATIRRADSWESFGMSRMAIRDFTYCGMEGSYEGRQLTSRELSNMTRHPQPVQVDYSCITNVPKATVDTDRVSKVTLAELARFVLDGTPIERKTKEEVVYQTSYAPNETSESVETKLGNISVVERTE